MRKYLLPETGSDYKANLHCHSTISDGRLTPEELKEAYKARGYSIIAYTDHDIMLDHGELDDENFLALRGYELEVNGVPENHVHRTAHICFIATKKDNFKQVCSAPKYLFANAVKYADKLNIDEEYERIYTCEGVSDMMKRGRDAGFYVTYNHPAWSLEAYPQYSGYEGMHAMEIYNTGCVREGYPDYNERVYDDLLGLGRRISCVAADDNHNARAKEDPLYDSFGGWVVIRADKLEYETVTDALLAGDYYASCGPEIKELYIEDDRVYIKTSPCKKINFITGTRTCAAVGANEGEYITEASFAYAHYNNYFRLDVIDEHGNHANTKGYFVDEL